jgi:hypothetical protein
VARDGASREPRQSNDEDGGAPGEPTRVTGRATGECCLDSNPQKALGASLGLDYLSAGPSIRVRLFWCLANRRSDLRLEPG